MSWKSWNEDRIPHTFASSAITKDKLQSFAEISQSQKCLAAAPTRADESRQNENTSRIKNMSLIAQTKKKYNFVCLPHVLSLNHKQ